MSLVQLALDQTCAELQNVVDYQVVTLTDLCSYRYKLDDVHLLCSCFYIHRLYHQLIAELVVIFSCMFQMQIAAAAGRSK
jgi:hypothetical protein